MKDYCIRVSAGNGSIRGFGATTTNLVNEACKRHKTYPTASAALGRVLTATLMMGAMLKGDDLVTVRLLGDGPLGAVVASANAKGQVRGYVQEPHTQTKSKYPGKLDVGSAVGKNGMLHVTKDLGLKEPYTGSVPLVSGEIAEDLAYYYQVSEQTPSAVALGVLIDIDYKVLASGGFIIQLLPNAKEEIAVQLENNINNLPPISEMIREGETPETILGRILNNFAMTIHEKIPVEFSCPCSKSRLESVLISLGKEELEAMIAEQGKAELVCHFCAEKYNFNKDELERLLREAASK
ncbi:MAG: Hsp33 family molecular chaperone HslO [Zhaonellaceae bacterium]|jgi:molecular chaperone Hsp33|nr:Hsp33 family molecular chaperone HslO [Clostridia bacterium]